MKVIALVVLLAGVAVGQATPQNATPEAALPSLKNHQILLAPSSMDGTAYSIYVAPDGKLAILPTKQIVELIKQGYRPYTFGELQDSLTQMFQLNASLNEQVAELRKTQQVQSAAQPQPQKSFQDKFESVQAAAGQADHNVPETHTPTREETEAANRAAQQQADMQRRQLLLRYLIGQQPQRVNMNVTVTDCTKYPALCVHPPQ